ncbi:hypothetical protein PM082_007237 [Marasmius tenuissimus]|nr:hypothetical protein PM082_007237 [Marasmius tenuissimus]
MSLQSPPAIQTTTQASLDFVSQIPGQMRQNCIPERTFFHEKSAVVRFTPRHQLTPREPSATYSAPEIERFFLKNVVYRFYSHHRCALITAEPKTSTFLPPGRTTQSSDQVQIMGPGLPPLGNASHLYHAVPGDQ